MGVKLHMRFWGFDGGYFYWFDPGWLCVPYYAELDNYVSTLIGGSCGVDEETRPRQAVSKGS